jgi:hypothetical protein
MARVPHRRKANDLYKRGKVVVIDDGDTDWIEELDDDDNPIIDSETGRPKLVEVPASPVTMWVSKLAALDMSTAMKFATQAQAVVLAGKDRESTAFAAIRDALKNLDRKAWVGIILEQAMHGRLEVVEARVQHATVLNQETGEEEPGRWAKDGYLEGLFSAWVEKYQVLHAQDHADDGALRILGEIEKFNKEVERELEFEIEVEQQTITPWDDDTVLDRATEVIIEGEGTEAWSNEYMNRIVFLAARDCDGPDPDRPGKCLCRGSRAKHPDFHFEGYEDAADADDLVKRRIYDAYCQVQVDPLEGKGSPAKPASSTLSELLAVVAASGSSSPAA